MIKFLQSIYFNGIVTNTYMYSIDNYYGKILIKTHTIVFQ